MNLRPTYYATITINRMDGAMDSIIRNLHLNEQDAVIDAMDFIKEMDERYEMGIPWDELEYGMDTIKWIQRNRRETLFVNIEWVPGELLRRLPLPPVREYRMGARRTAQAALNLPLLPPNHQHTTQQMNHSSETDKPNPRRRPRNEICLNQQQTTPPRNRPKHYRHSDNSCHRCHHQRHQRIIITTPGRLKCCMRRHPHRGFTI